MLIGALVTLAASPALACQVTVGEDATVNGSWFASCTSTNRSGSYAQYYTFTLTRTSDVQIDLISSVDTYLYLLSGDRPSNRPIASDNNSGENLNARLYGTLTPGTYTIEATTAQSALTGSFRLSLRSDGGIPSCLIPVDSDTSQNGTWSDECISVHRRGSYARYYTFTITETMDTQIDLVSNADTYLYLLSGDSPSNRSIASDNNSGGNFQARIEEMLVAGTYTIEAVTEAPQVTDSFRLSLRTNGGGDNCRVLVDANATRRDSWTDACISVHRSGSLARYYTFALQQPAHVQVNLLSSADSYLYLLAGDKPNSRSIASDNNGGGNSNARIYGTLAAGTYTIEATTNEPGVTGPFTLAVRSDGGGAACRTRLEIGKTARGRWAPACVSVHRLGSNARYYTFVLRKASRVQIDLTSPVDSYLHLLAGGTASSRSINQNNNGSGKKDARIVQNLPAGTYTIEATTNEPGRVGAFTVRLSQLRSASSDEALEEPEEEP